MTDDALKARNAERLMELDPWIAPKIAAILTDLAGHGYRPRIQCAWRSLDDQMAAVASGHSKVRFGEHNRRLRGKPASMAADILDDDHPMAPSREFLAHLKSSAQAHGLDCPIDWDPCHVQRVAPVWRTVR